MYVCMHTRPFCDYGYLPPPSGDDLGGWGGRHCCCCWVFRVIRFDSIRCLSRFGSLFRVHAVSSAFSCLMPSLSVLYISPFVSLSLLHSIPQPQPPPPPRSVSTSPPRSQFGSGPPLSFPVFFDAAKTMMVMVRFWFFNGCAWMGWGWVGIA